MADSLSDDFSPLDDELDDDMVMEAEFLPDTHIEYLDDDDDDDESPADIEAALFALSQEEMGPSNLEPLSADEPQYIDVSDAEDLLLDALSEGIPSSQELDEASAIELEDESFEVSAIEPEDESFEASAIELEDESFEVSAIEPEDESFEASAIEPEDEPYEVSAIEPEDESDAEALIADLFGDDDMFPDESTSSPLEEISEASPVVDDEFVDEDSIDAMEAALMRMAEEEFSNSAVVAPVEDDFSSSFQATEDFILDDIEDSLKRMAADEQEGNPVFPDQSSDSSSIESQATGADDETDDDFDSPEAIEAALLRLAGQDYHPSVDNRGRDAGDDSPSIDAMMPPSFDEEEIVGGGQALGLHFEPDDELDEDSPELIEAALLRLARDESGEESDIVANETSMDDLDAELNSLMDDLDGSFEEDSPEVALVENLSAELSPPDDDLDPLESIVTMDTVEIPVSSVFEDIPDIVPDEFAEGNSFEAVPEIFGDEFSSEPVPEIFGDEFSSEAVPEIFGDEFSSEPVPEIFGNEFSAEPVPEIFGNEFSAEPVQEFPGDEFSEGPVSEIFADELASGPLVQPSYDSTSLNLGDLVGPASPAVSFDSGTEEGAVTSIILPEDDDDLGFALDALASESFGENTSSDYENTSSDYENTSSDYESALDNSVLGDLEELDNILLSSDGEAAPMFTDSFDGLTEDFPEQGAIESDVLAEEEALVDDYDPEPFAEPVAQAVKPVVGGLDSLSLDLSSLVGGSSNTSAQPSFDAEEGAVSRIILSGSGSDDALEDALNALTSAEGFDSSVSGNDFDGLSIDEPGSPLEQALDNMSDDALLDDQFNTEPVYEEFSLESPIESAYDVIPESREEFYEDGVLPVTEDSFFADALADAEEVLSQDSQEILQDSFIFSPDGFDVNAPGESQIDAVGTFTQDDRLSVDPLANEAPVFDDYGQDVPFAASGSLDDAFEAASMVFNEAPSTGKFDEPVSHFVFDPEPEPEFVEPFEAPLQGYYADGPPEYLFGGGEAQTSDFVQEVAAPVGPRIMPAGIGLSPEVENIVGPQVDDFSTIFKSVELIVSNGNSAVIEEELSILESTYPDDSKVIFALGALDILRNYHTSGTARLFNAAQRCHFSSDFDNEIYVLERLYSEDNTDTGLTHTLADRLMASDQSFRAAFVLRESADRSLEAGATSDAISLLEKAIVADPEDDSAFALLLQAYRAIGRDSQALEVINSRLASAPDKLELLMEQSISLYRLGRLDMAEEVFEGVMIYSADSIDILLDLEAGYDRDDVTTFREKCRERILMIDSTNEAIIKKIRKEDRLASLELDVPLLEDLLPYDEPDVEQGSSAFVSGFGDEDEVPDTMFTRAISVSPRCSALIEQLESLEGEMKILEDGEQVADRYVAELVRKFLEVGSKISTDDPANAMAFYDRSRSYLNYFDDPAASFLWSEQLERRISSLRELIQTER
jgi:tetratricopeptide (TPR) repeat protein